MDNFDGLTDLDPWYFVLYAWSLKKGICNLLQLLLLEPVDYDDFIYTVSEFSNHLPFRVPHSIQLPSRNL